MGVDRWSHEGNPPDAKDATSRASGENDGWRWRSKTITQAERLAEMDATNAKTAEQNMAAMPASGSKGDGMDEVRILTTTGHDEADAALDTLEFVMCAQAAMETTYSDQVMNGLFETMHRSVTLLRDYVSRARVALLEFKQRTDNATHSPTDGRAEGEDPLEFLPSPAFVSAVNNIVNAASVVSADLAIMAKDAGRDDLDRERMRSSKEYLDEAIREVEPLVDKEMTEYEDTIMASMWKRRRLEDTCCKA